MGSWCNAVLLAGIALGSCRSQPENTATRAGAVRARDGHATLLGRVRLGVNARGLSGLTRGGDGRLWSIPERVRQLLPFKVEGTEVRPAGEPIAIEGLPDGWDTESLAWVAGNTFALGTETQDRGRETDHLVLVEVEGQVARVKRSIALPYALWGIRARVNRGIEGLCHVDGVLLAGNENVIEEGENRFAPLARYDLAAGTWEPFRVRLVTGSGKIAAVACRPTAGDAIDVLAIERHYGVSRLLRFQVPRTGPRRDLVARELSDLGKLIAGVPNLEGIDWSDDRVVLFADNDSGGVTGPCEAVLLRLDSL